MTRKIVDVEYKSRSGKPYQQIILTLNETFNPHLLKDIYCTHIGISWFPKLNNFTNEIKMIIQAINRVDNKDGSVKKVTEWQEISIADAIEYIYENLC